MLPSTQKLHECTHTCSNVTDKRRARCRALPSGGRVSRLSRGASVLTNGITGNKQVVLCTQAFHTTILPAIQFTTLPLSKFPLFLKVLFPTPQLELRWVCNLVLGETTANYVKRKPQRWSLSKSAFDIESKFWSEVTRCRGAKKHPYSCISRVPSRPLLMFSLLAPYSSSPSRRRQSRGAISTVPLSAPHLISVVQSFETSVSRRTKEWWSMCNKCQCHGNPHFPPKIFLFIPFEDLSPGRADITRPQAKPWQSLFSACSLID